jgi:tetratricopeptide (TPR) repeat protein
MPEYSRFSENEDLQELLSLYERLRSGNGSGFLSEESFERIVDHFDDQDAIPKAMEAVELGIQQFPYSSSLLVKKADLLIATRQYSRALSLLDKAEILDKNDIDIYILRTDAYLALDQQSKAVTLLEEAIQQFVHSYYFPTLEKLGIVTNIKEVHYRGTDQTVWQIHGDKFLENLNRYPRWV